MNFMAQYANSGSGAEKKFCSTLVDKTQPRPSRTLDTVMRPERYWKVYLLET